LQDSQLPFEWLPSLGSGDKLVRRSPGPEVISQLIKGATESLGRSKAFKTQHRAGALFHAPVVLLDAIIFGAAAPMLHLLPEHFGDGPRIGGMSVGGDLFGTASGHRLSTSEEALGSRPISFRTEHRVDELPLPIDGSIQITPAAAHLQIRLIDVLAATHLALVSTPDLVGQQRSETRFPVAHRFMVQLVATNQEHWASNRASSA
jgi:hypothetical protein